MAEDTLYQKAIKLVPIAAVFAALVAIIMIIMWIGQTFGLGHMLTEPFLGGIFNYPIVFGIQVYFWLFIVWIFAIIASEIFWRFTFWDPISPFHGLFRAFIDGSKAALVADRNLDWALLSESGATIALFPEDYRFATEQLGWWIRLRAWIYKPDFSAAIASQLEGKKDEQTLITIGRIATHLIIDTEWWTDKKSPQRKAIREACLKYNKEHPNDPQVHRLSTFMKYVNDGLIPKPDGVNMETLVPWARVIAAFPIVRSDAAWAGTVRQIAEDMIGQSGADLNRWAIYVLIFGGLIIAAMFVGSWIFPHAPAAAVATQVTPIITPPGF